MEWAWPQSGGVEMSLESVLKSVKLFSVISVVTELFTVAAALKRFMFRVDNNISCFRWLSIKMHKHPVMSRSHPQCTWRPAENVQGVPKSGQFRGGEKG